MTDDPQGGPTVLNRWSCYVDRITPTHVFLVMKDADAGRNADEIEGSFPAALLSHIEYGRGTYLTVTARNDGSLTIERTPPQYGPPSSEHLVDMLRRL